MTVELALSPDSRRGTDPARFIAASAAAGFSAVGLAAADASVAGAALLEASGLRCHELLALMVSTDKEATLAQASQLAEAAARVRARWVLTIFLTPLESMNVPLLRRCAAMFAAAGAGLAVEFSPMGPVATLADALGVVGLADAGQAGVLIDTWHFFRGETTWEQLAQVPLEQIAYVQFDDALPLLPESTGFKKMMFETMDRRAMPGSGEFELERFAATLLDRGWDGLVSVEVLSAELRTRPEPEFAATAYQAAARYWR